MNETIITRFISAWAWHILGIMFLNTAIIMLAIGRPLWALSSFGVLMFCEVVAYKRKREVEEFEDEN